MHTRMLMLGILVIGLGASEIFALAGTYGTPLGGMGTGYVKYDAGTGDFMTSSKLVPAAGNMNRETDLYKSLSSGFHFLAGTQPVTKAKTIVEDAKCPLYTANFGATNGVTFSLNAFGPYISGDNDLNTKLISSPLAFFEITAKNDGTAAIDVAVALEFANLSSATSGLLGGADNAVLDPESGNMGISFPTATYADVPSNPNNTGNAYIMSGCGKPGATFSAGAMGTFTTTGTLANTDGNCVAAKCNVGVGESVTFKFVMAWWRTFISGQDRFGVGKNDENNFFYHNFYQTSKDAAVFGMQNFDVVKNGVVTMVNRVMASSFPDWYKDRLLNNLYPLVQNAMWTKDGRVAFWEGGYGIIGTIDQGQHAAIWYTHNWPTNQWLELSYWLSNAFQSDGFKGQIHHDFNMGPEMGFEPPESRFMAPWDHWDRRDYWYQPDTKNWSDLNSMLIFKAYELMLATGNRDSLVKHFPRILQTADRLHQMSQEAGGNIPTDSRSTYDSKGVLTPQYACGVAVTSYKAMVEMAKFVGDQATAIKYQTIYEAARAEYKTKLFNDAYGAQAELLWQEGHVGGYSWANYFCLPPIQDLDFITAGCTRSWNIYSSGSALVEKVGGWHFYTYDHLGGALTAIGRPDDALQFHQWDYDLYYKDLPGMVFWQSLFSANAGAQNFFSYMTAPSVWRSYFQFMGYMLDNANKRLWIRPALPTVMNKKIVNAALPNPYGWGTLNYDETGDVSTKLIQQITVTYDNPVIINEIVLKNNTSAVTPKVKINDVETGFLLSSEDWGVEKNVRVNFTTPVTIGPAGLKIAMYDENVGIVTSFNRSGRTPLGITSSALSKGSPIVFSIDQPGKVSIELLSLKGAKIGTLMNHDVAAAGKHSFMWNGTTVDGRNIGTSMGILRLSTQSGMVAKLVMNSIK